MSTKMFDCTDVVTNETSLQSITTPAISPGILQNDHSDNLAITGGRSQGGVTLYLAQSNRLPITKQSAARARVQVVGSGMTNLKSLRSESLPMSEP